MTKSGRFSRPAKSDHFRKCSFLSAARPRTAPDRQRATSCVSPATRKAARHLLRQQSSFNFSAMTRSAARSESCSWMFPAPRLSDEIAGIEHVADVAMHAIQARLISHPAMAVRGDLISDRLAADAGDRRFARSINIRHDDVIGVVERRGQILAATPWCANNDAAETLSARVSARRFALSPESREFPSDDARNRRPAEIDRSRT